MKQSLRTSIGVKVIPSSSVSASKLSKSVQLLTFPFFFANFLEFSQVNYLIFYVVYFLKFLFIFFYKISIIFTFPSQDFEQKLHTSRMLSSL